MFLPSLCLSLSILADCKPCAGTLAINYLWHLGASATLNPSVLLITWLYCCEKVLPYLSKKFFLSFYLMIILVSPIGYRQTHCFLWTAPGFVDSRGAVNIVSLDFYGVFNVAFVSPSWWVNISPENLSSSVPSNPFHFPLWYNWDLTANLNGSLWSSGADQKFLQRTRKESFFRPRTCMWLSTR